MSATEFKSLPFPSYQVLAGVVTVLASIGGFVWMASSRTTAAFDQLSEVNQRIDRIETDRSTVRNAMASRMDAQERDIRQGLDVAQKIDLRLTRMEALLEMLAKNQPGTAPHR